MKRESIGIGLIGCGRQGIRLLEAISNIEEAKIIAAADIDPDSTERANAKVSYNDYQYLLENKDVDAVLIALPHNILAKAVIDSANAGKHIFVEKPMAMNNSEVEQIKNAVIESGVTLMVGYSLRFKPSVIRMKNLIEEGKIGQVNLIDAAKHCEVLEPENTFMGKRKWLAHADKGGGILLWIGCHIIDTVLWMANSDIKRVYGDIQLDPVLGIDIISSFTILFKNGVLANVNISSQNWGEDYRFESIDILGSEGCIKATAAARGLTTGPKGGWTLDIAIYREKDENYGDPVIETPVKANTTQREMDEFIMAISENRDPKVTLSDGAKVIQVIDAIWQSNKTGRAVEF